MWKVAWQHSKKSGRIFSLSFFINDSFFVFLGFFSVITTALLLFLFTICICCCQGIQEI